MKYPNDGSKTTLDLSDDAAHVNWGGNWRIPTYNELYELETKCTWIWTSDYNGTGVKGYIASSKTNGNSIFLPASGCRHDSSNQGVGSYGYYWSSSLFSESGSYKSAYLSIYSSDVFCYIGNRSLGYSVRPVCQ